MVFSWKLGSLENPDFTETHQGTGAHPLPGPGPRLSGQSTWGALGGLEFLPPLPPPPPKCKQEVFWPSSSSMLGMSRFLLL